MTRQVIRQVETFAAPPPRVAEVPQLDEGLWQAWIEKNEDRDKIKFARRVKIIAILVLLLGVVALVRVVS